jgi:hypothetical protein
MIVEQFRTTLAADPFVPFAVRTVDGEVCPIRSPQGAWVPAGSRLAFVALNDGSARIIDLRLVTMIEFSAEDAADRLLQ